MDAIHYKVRDEGRIVSKAAYIVLGVTTEGYKDILSITVGANESSKFWLGMLNDLKNRGVQDVLFSVWTACRASGMPSRLCSHRRRSSGASSICCAIPLNMSIIAT